MGNFRYRMAQFLMGRNGFDNFCRGLLFLAMILIIADIFVPGSVLHCFGIFIFQGFFQEYCQASGRKCLVHIMCAGPVPFIYEPGPQALQVFQMSDMQTGPPGSQRPREDKSHLQQMSPCI